MKENEIIEFKKSTSELKEGVISIGSILNKHHGGKLYFGIRNDGKVLGQTVTAKTIRDISQAISNHIEPKIFPKIKEIVLEGKKCILVDFSGNNVPYYAYGRAYIRVGDEDRLLSAKELENIILEKNKDKLAWDKEICKEAKLNDIDQKKVKWYLQEREKARNVSKEIKIPIKELLTNLKCLKDGCPTNAGMLFFGKKPLNFISHAQLRLIKIKGVKIYENILDRLDCQGTLWEMLEQAEEFIRKNIRLLGFRTGKSFRREDKFDYPIKALREAIINALIHRDYFNPADVRVLVLDDRVEVISPGSFPEGVTPEKPEHRPVNKILSNLMYDIGFIEKYGSGIYLENELCLKNGNKKPLYNVTINQTKVVFQSQVKDITTLELDETKVKGLNKRQINFVKSNVKDISRKEYSKLENCSIKTAFNDLQDLLKKEIVKKEGGGKYVRYIRI